MKKYIRLSVKLMFLAGLVIVFDYLWNISHMGVTDVLLIFLILSLIFIGFLITFDVLLLLQELLWSYASKHEKDFNAYLNTRYAVRTHPGGGISIRAISNLSLYISSTWILVGLAFTVTGIACLVVASVGYYSLLFDIGFFLLGSGSSVTLAEVRNVTLNRKIADQAVKETVKNQCYAWLLGVNIIYRALGKPDDRTREMLTLEYRSLLGELAPGNEALATSFNRFANEFLSGEGTYLNDLLQSARYALGDKYGMFDFFRASVIILNEAAMKTPFADFKDDTEQTYGRNKMVWGLYIYNNPVITFEFVESLRDMAIKGDRSNIVDVAYSVKKSFSIWFNGMASLDDIPILFYPRLGPLPLLRVAIKASTQENEPSHQ